MMDVRARARLVLLAGALVLFTGCSSRTVVLLEDGPAASPELGLDVRVDHPLADRSAADLPRPDLFAPDLPTPLGTWVISAGGAKSSVEGQDVATDSKGNAYVTGVFYGIVTFGATTLKSKGQRDLFVAKVSPSGGFLWAIGAGGNTAVCRSANLAVDSGNNTYVASHCHAYKNSDTTITIGNQVLSLKAGLFYKIVARVSPAGSFSWAVAAEFAHQSSCDLHFMPWSATDVVIAAASTGDTFITGCLNHKATFGSTVLTTIKTTDGTPAYYDNVYVARLSPSGAFLWTISSGSANHDGAHGIAVDGSGNAVVAGDYADDGTTTLGTTVLKPKDHWNLFLAWVSPSGAFLSATSPGSAPTGALDSPKALGLDSAGNAYLTGHATLKATFGSLAPVEWDYILKVNSAGTPLWISSGYVNHGLFCDVAIDSNGAAHTTGHLYPYSNPLNTVTIGKTTLTTTAKGFDDVAVVKVSPMGTVQSAYSSTGTSTSWAWGLGIAVDSADNTYVVGNYGGTVTFGSTTLTSKTNLGGNHDGDLFIWRIPAAKGSDAGP